MDYRNEAPEVLKGFLIYHETIKGHSKATVEEYFLDLRTFFRYLKIIRGNAPRNTDINSIDIKDIDIDFVSAVNINEIYDYLSYLSRDRVKNQNSKTEKYGLSPATRARKVATLRSYYKYLVVKAQLLTDNPIKDLDSPKIPKTLPKYLSVDESMRLLNATGGKNDIRDYCIICIFLNCGLRISEIVNLNVNDIREDHIRVIGKGNKERIVFLNDSTVSAINDYISVRKHIASADKNALFLSNRRSRMSRESIHAMVKNTLLKAGLDMTNYSSHKLRHTCATLMLKNGVDVRTLQEILGHEHLNTTQIYTHVDSSDLRMAAAANPLGNFTKSGSTHNE
ncbi:MAG: tyrosine recombinase XerC [Oscillospiraceae bacterium]|nr:tyrosine recombinase XerC [Oscillospiraceae bacterium]